MENDKIKQMVKEEVGKCLMTNEWISGPKSEREALGRVLYNVAGPASVTLGKILNSPLSLVYNLPGYFINLQQFLKNIRGHVKQVEAVENIDIENKDCEFSFQLSEWMAGAGRVDPNRAESSELASLWQALLLPILEGKENNEIFLEKLKKLTPQTARMLLDVGNKKVTRVRTPQQLAYVKELEKLGLITGDYMRVAAYIVGFAMTLAWTFLVIRFLRPVSNDLENMDRILPVSLFFVFLGAFVFVFSERGHYVRSKYLTWRLTYLGDALVKWGINMKR